MARELDRSKPYGTIHHSEQSDGRAFEQNGVFFDVNGKEWTPPPPPQSEVEKAAIEKAAFDAAVEKRAQELLAQREADKGKGK